MRPFLSLFAAALLAANAWPAQPRRVVRSSPIQRCQTPAASAPSSVADATRSVTPARENPNFTAAAEKAYDTRAAAIEAELKTPNGDPWAGQYYGLIHVFSWAPRSGWVFKSPSCCGPFDQNYGELAAADGSLRLEFALPNPRDSAA